MVALLLDNIVMLWIMCTPCKYKDHRNFHWFCVYIISDGLQPENRTLATQYVK